MKYSLTITDASPSELAKVLAMLGAGAPVTVATTVNTNTDDDESGDADAAPGTVDNTGLPWDDRIHSTPAKLTAKKVWRRRKGVSDELVAAVEAELRARATSPAPMPAAPAPMVPNSVTTSYAPPPQSFDPATQTQVAQPVYQPQPAPPVPAPAYAPPPQSFDAAAQPVYQQPAPPAPVPQPQAPAAPLDFNGFMMHIQTLLPTGKVDAGYLANLSQRLGIGAITDLSARPDLIGQAVHTMQTEQRW